jgi:hypothetical protein
MEGVELYGLKAAECHLAAETATDPAARASLFALAGQWSLLALAGKWLRMAIPSPSSEPTVRESCAVPE